mgnify:CR=1 FL=1
MAALAPACFVAACGAFSSSEPAPSPSPSPSGDASAPDGPGVDIDASAADSGESDVACVPYDLPAVADISPGVTECDVSISRGIEKAGNIGVGVLFVRFEVGAAAFAALRGSSARNLRLVLKGNPTCSGSCNVPAEAGELRAYVMRGDWVEGDGGEYSGADMCRRTATRTDGWGAGAQKTRISLGADYGPTLLGSFKYPNDATSAIIPLQLGPLLVDFQRLPATGVGTGLAFFVDEALGGKFVAGTKEAAGLEPHLMFEACPR